MNRQRSLQLRKAIAAVGCSVAVTLIFPSTSVANSLEDEWRAFQQAEQASFSHFLSEHDREFISFLEQHWEEFDQFQGKVRDATPKPAKAPAVKNWLFSTDENEKSEAREYRPKAVLGKGKHFFGHHINVVSLEKVEFPRLSNPNNKILAAAWKAMAEVNNQQAIAQIKQAKHDLGLGDWGTYLYINFLIAQQITNENERKAYLWFLLSKLGYDVKLSYGKHDIYLMLPSKQTIYGKNFLQISGKTYYLVEATKHQGPLYSYAGKYDQRNRELEMNFEHVLRGTENALTRTISFKDEDGEAELSLKYDAGYSQILNAYPQLDLQYYFSAVPNQTLVNSLRAQLKPRLTKMEKREAIDYLLRLLQTGFTYALDQDQFGEENYLLGEESLFYSANDCEDRSILLAWLIKDLLQIEVVGLDFPGHIAIAVALAPKENDWAIASEGETFVIADPTYIGATAGMVMPDYKNTIPKLIHF